VEVLLPANGPGWGQKAEGSDLFLGQIFHGNFCVEAIEGQLASLNENTLAGKVAYTFGQLIDKYPKEELPELAW